MSNLHVRDCLGSVRGVVDLSGGTVLERNDYYAYGERVADSTMQTTSLKRWRYNAKEEQASIAGLPYLDYGARFYDPVIGRWLQQDPIAEKYPHLSPYNFCGNNPVNYVDPDGRKIVFINGFSKHWMKSFGYLAPGVDYWSPEVIRKAKKVLRDDKISIESHVCPVKVPDVLYKVS